MRGQDDMAETNRADAGALIQFERKNRLAFSVTDNNTMCVVR